MNSTELLDTIELEIRILSRLNRKKPKHLMIPPRTLDAVRTRISQDVNTGEYSILGVKILCVTLPEYILWKLH